MQFCTEYIHILIKASWVSRIKVSVEYVHLVILFDIWT